MRHVFLHTLCVLLYCRGVCELRQEMTQQKEDLLREMEHLKSELTSEFYVCMYA